ncbi:sugar ABC transporter substrate-binding protein [Anopheles sinensis]|uniref:Sugar ABC transporter substrate-binding protein n=1 Tax=Anopheles sinensis TaxID=74873 RepID=A0A084VUT7_ANOSI|nr:sugar ABC transporter substrate-binding protein [Anopheles sinensis]
MEPTHATGATSRMKRDTLANVQFHPLVIPSDGEIIFFAFIMPSEPFLSPQQTDKRLLGCPGVGDHDGHIRIPSGPVLMSDTYSIPLEFLDGVFSYSAYVLTGLENVVHKRTMTKTKPNQNPVNVNYFGIRSSPSCPAGEDDDNDDDDADLL